MIFEKDQKFVINKIKHYQNSNCKKNSSFNSEYFSSVSNNFCFALMQFWLGKKRFLTLLKYFFFELYFCLNINNYNLIAKNINFFKFKKIILTWGNEKNLSNNNFYDKFLNINSSKNKNILWIVIYSGDKSKIKFLNNVIYVTEVKISFYKKIFNFLSWILCSILKKKINKKNLLTFFSWHNFFSFKIINIIKLVIKKNIRFFFIIYEAQPFQTETIYFIKKNFSNIRCIGYVHSFPPFASHMLKKDYSPDQIILNSYDQQSTFCKYLGWNNKEIKLMPSARFRINANQDMVNKIYLPINFFSSNNILFNFRKIIDYLQKYNLKNFIIQNHPECLQSRKHIRLIYDMNLILSKLNNGKKILKNTSIFIGATGSVIEALLYGLDVYHIVEDPLFEAYSPNFWPSIKLTFLNDRIIKYKVKNFGFMKFGKSDYLVTKYLNV